MNMELRHVGTVIIVLLAGSIFSAIRRGTSTHIDGSIQKKNAPISSFPLSPHPSLTPGSLCTKPTAYRYRERIPYCERNVHVYVKAEVIRQYDTGLGYRIGELPREEFKIDHYIPLCMGGSNEMDNLWPQHQSVYTLTDPLEKLLCDKLVSGRMTQEDAVAMIRRAKNHLKDITVLRVQIEAR